LRWIGGISFHLHDVIWVGLGVLPVAGLAALIWALRLGRLGRGRAKLPEARRQWARRLADAAFDGLLIHRNGTILQMNNALVRLLGYREAEMLGTNFSSLTHPGLTAALRTELEAPPLQITAFTLLHADKSERFVELASHTLEFNGLPATITAIRDITQLRELQERLEHVTQNDGLTSLPNRSQFTKMLQQSIIGNDRGGGTTAVLLLKVDRLKAINEAFGRSGGDRMLQQIALRLTGFKHESDIVGRLDGDKFGIIQPHTGAPNRNASLVNQIENSFDEPFIIDGKAVTASLSIGVAIYPEHATDAEGLLWAGNLAMECVSEAGGGGSRMFQHEDAKDALPPKTVVEANANPTGSMTENFRGTMRSTQRLAQELGQAISRGEVSLDYQPFFASKFLSLAGFEAFARWRHPKDGLIPPDQFVHLAEQSGLGTALGNFILETACIEAMRSKSPLMSVNLSPTQLQDPDLPTRVREILRKTGLPPERLEFEVTEAVLNAQPQQKLQALQDLRAIGAGIVLDDFGTGFSSLTSLTSFPFSKIKIEKRIIRALGEDEHAEAVLGAILALARNFRVEVVAEGVETEAQLVYLQEKNCQFVQGYHLGRPAAQAAHFPAAQAANFPTVQAAVPPVSEFPAALATKPSLVATQR
jgi:diguanylate cyclase (GGDEF)-like protein/PAS domain S-box-containing protein